VTIGAFYSILQHFYVFGRPAIAVPTTTVIFIVTCIEELGASLLLLEAESKLRSVCYVLACSLRYEHQL
jgi:hypothetical protein